MTTRVVPWLTEEEQATWRSFITASRLIEGALDRQLTRDSGIGHGHYVTLVALSEAHGGAARMGDLADHLQYSPSRMSHAIRRLERDGLVRRRSCPTDGRGQEAVLTSKGRTALEQAAPGHVREVRRLLIDQLAAEERAALRSISELLLERMTEA